MPWKKEIENLRTLVDSDVGFLAKRRMLVITALILLVVSLSGARISEANTFILKITFANQQALGSILLLTLVFLMIRYYSYAHRYYETLYNVWSFNMLQNTFYGGYDGHEHELNGILYNELLPNNVSKLDILNGEVTVSCTYHCYFPFQRSIKYEIKSEYDVNDYIMPIKGVGWKKAFNVYYLELKYQIEFIVKNRFFLDIYAPYLIAVFALLSHAFTTDILYILSYMGL